MRCSSRPSVRQPHPEKSPIKDHRQRTARCDLGAPATTSLLTRSLLLQPTMLLLQPTIHTAWPLRIWLLLQPSQLKLQPHSRRPRTSSCCSRCAGEAWSAGKQEDPSSSLQGQEEIEGGRGGRGVRAAEDGSGVWVEGQ